MGIASLKKKVAVGAAVVVAGIGSSAAFGYLTQYGEGASTADVALAPPAVDGGTTVHALLRDTPTGATITVTNTSGETIKVASIPVRSSRQHQSTLDEPWYCPAGSVTVGKWDTNAIVPLEDPSGITHEGDISEIADGEQATFAVSAFFDTTSAAFSDTGDPAQNQDGCLGHTLAIDFGPITLVQP
jgi:hypothetical protein